MDSCPVNEACTCFPKSVLQNSWPNSIKWTLFYGMFFSRVPDEKQGGCDTCRFLLTNSQNMHVYFFLEMLLTADDKWTRLCHSESEFICVTSYSFII